MNGEDILYKVALSKIQGIGPILARQLVSYCGNAREVFFENLNSLHKIPGISVAVAKNIKSGIGLKMAEEEVALAEKACIKIIFYEDPDYPARLKHFNDSPVVLYWRGNVSLNAPRTVGVVGTRTPSPYGKSVCDEFIENISNYNPIVISGLAYGIDIIAHRKSIDLNIPTIAISGTGWDTIYPQEHSLTARKILDNGGLLTEFGFGTKADRENFPKRNRIIASLCDALVIVESAQKGGSMITAEFANGYFKDVFAFPGRSNDPYSRGCNQLIKDNKAILIESADDLVKTMRWDEKVKRNVIQKQLPIGLSPEEQNILEILNHHEEAGIDILIRASNLQPGALAGLLLQMELKGIIKTLPGKRYKIDF